MPTRFIFFDTETEDIDGKGKQKMKLAYAVYWEVGKNDLGEKIVWFNTTKQEDLYNWIVSKCRSPFSIRVLSANIWFDLRVSGLLHQMRLSRWLCNGFFSKGHTFIATFRQGNYRLEFVNVQNYFNFPVDRIGESIGLPKLEVDLNNVSDADLRLYCKRDVEIIFKAFRSLYLFIKDNNLGSLGYTLPSIGYSAYLHSFIPHNITVHTQEDVLELERKAYFGGRCECFRIGEFTGERFYKLDVNSMYPFVMYLHQYPVRLDKVAYRIDMDTLYKFKHKWCYVAEVELDTNEPCYPYRQDGKLIFPLGKFVTYLTTPSLLYAIEKGHVITVRMVAAYFYANLFREFVDYFYSKRLEYREKGNPAFAYVCKLILNSLYGKFGQRRSETIEEKTVDSEESYRRLIWHVQEKKFYVQQVFFGLEQLIQMKEGEAINSVPSISAHVTDYARLYLWKLIKTVRFKNCFYVDTDSLIVNEQGLTNLKKYYNTQALGMVKIEEVTKHLEIRGAKNYTFGGSDKIKGIPSKAKKIDKRKYRYSHFPTPIAELRCGLKEDYRVEVREKQLTGIYDKGIVLKSGKVKPFTLGG